MHNTETINFEIILENTYESIKPCVDVVIDDHVVYSKDISKKTSVIKFSHQLDLEKSHTLKIKRKNINKSSNDLGLLWLDTLKIDDIDIQHIVWTKSFDFPDFPEPWYSNQIAAGMIFEYPVNGGTHWGHDGEWRLEFTSPFYKFLMDQAQ